MDCFIGTMGIDIMLLGCTLGARYHFFIIYFLSALILYLSDYLRKVVIILYYIPLVIYFESLLLLGGWLRKLMGYEDKFGVFGFCSSQKLWVRR